MSTILIINAGKDFGHSHGKLNGHLSTVAQQTLTELGHEVHVTTLEEGYDVEAEVARYLWADIITYQQPVWWMGPPWTLKKYIDEVFTVGHGRIYGGDGRSRDDSSKQYGSGGLIRGKKYMISTTWNAPNEAFNNPAQFFEGGSVDTVFFPFHKANQFLGMSALPTFSFFDVIKNPQIDDAISQFKAHLKAHIS